MLTPVQSDKRVRVGLRSKFVAAFATQIIVVTLLLLGIQQFLVRRAMIEQTVEQGSAIARAIEATAGYYVIFGLTDDLRNIVSDLSRSSSVSYAEFLDGSGKVLAASAAEVPPVLAQRKLQREHGEVAGAGLHVYTVSFYETKADAANPTAKPKGYFRLLMNESQAEKAAASLRGWNTVATALVLALASSSGRFWRSSTRRAKWPRATSRSAPRSAPATRSAAWPTRSTSWPPIWSGPSRASCSRRRSSNRWSSR
jgi:hypothetical protein